MTAAELELLRARVPEPLRAPHCEPEIAWWNADRLLVLAQVEDFRVALSRGRCVPRDARDRLHHACDELVHRAHRIASRS